MQRKLRYGIPFAVVAGALSVVSIAWACTPQNGQTFITTPNCLILCETARDRYIDVHARFMDPSYTTNDYDLYLSVLPWCHNSPNNVKVASDFFVDNVGTYNGEIPGDRLQNGITHTDVDNVPDGDATLHPDVHAWLARGSLSRRSYDVCFNSGQGADTTLSSYSSYPVKLTVK